MEQQMIEGQNYMTLAVKRSGKTTDSATHGGTGEFSSHELVESSTPVRISSGRTVSLGDFQFARISVGASLVDSDGDHDAAYEACLGIVQEVLAREIANISGQKYVAKVLKIDERFKNVTLTVDYGLTLSLKRYESAKVDIGLTKAISDGSILNDEIKIIQEYVSGRISDEAEKIKNLKDSKDVGI